MIARGQRECADRYEIVRDYCASNLGRGFTVCDIGANMAYFPLRLIEDFDAWAVAFEYHDYKARARKLRSERLLYLNRKVSLEDLTRMARLFGKFDLLLAMSVLHHVKGSTSEWIAGLRRLARHTIIELATDDSKRAMAKPDYYLSDADSGTLLGMGASHLRAGDGRPIIAFQGEEENA